MEEILMTNIKKNNCGRPAGRIKTAKIEISIEPAVKDEFMTCLLYTSCDVESGSKNPWSNQDKCIYLPCAGSHSGSIRHRCLLYTSRCV